MFINKFIKNTEYPICKNCCHFLKDELFENQIYAKCALFGEVDIVSGIITNTNAYRVRNDNNLCGQKGKYYKPIGIK